MRVRSVLVSLALVAASCGGDAAESTQTSPTTSSTTTSVATTTITTPPTTTTTASPQTTITTVIATTSTTVIPATDLESGLFCRDLRPRGYTYAEAVHYWMVEGRPDRMDADRNGIPCETVYKESDVLAYWGDPLPTSTTAPGNTTTIAAAVAWVQDWFDDQYAGSEPPTGVIGPSQLECEDSGAINVGDVFACILRSNHAPDFPLEDAGVVIYVLDDSGRSVWSAGTDVPDSTAGLRSAYAAVPHGMFCRDLLNPDTSAYPFDGYGRPATSAFFWSLVYWSMEGAPEHMDADSNGIPCETLYEPAIVSSVLDGGPTY